MEHPDCTNSFFHSTKQFNSKIAFHFYCVCNFSIPPNKTVKAECKAVLQL